MSMALPLKNRFFKFISIGIADQENTEQVRKTYLINIFSFVALLFLLPLGASSFLSALYPLSFALLGIAFILVLNYFYLKVTHNQNLAAYTISALFFFLMTYLIYAGGVSNTGPLWAYPLPIILMFLLGFRKGLFFIVLFIIINAVLLFFIDGDLLTSSYPYDFKVRIILSLILVTFLASASEYLLEKSFNDMQELKKSLELISRQDPLTGLFNRRIYDEDINKDDIQGVVLMCDIDHFKKINDYYGHTSGDIVLVQVAECIRKNIRKEDLAIRWGGEEFFIYLANSSLTNGYIVSEKLRQSIEKLPIRTCEDALVKVTISIGMSVVDHTTHFDQAIKNADDAMYMAKNSGRNKTKIYNMQPQELFMFSQV